jgi:hypothetical protein
MFNRTTSTKFFSPRRQDRKDYSFSFFLGVLCAFARGVVYPIFSSSRQDAKTAKIIRSRSSLASFAPLRENVLIRFLFLIAPRRQDRKDYSFSFFLGVLCAFARGVVYPIFSSSRQDAKTAKIIRSRSSLASFAPLRE